MSEHLRQRIRQRVGVKDEDKFISNIISMILENNEVLFLEQASWNRSWWLLKYESRLYRVLFENGSNELITIMRVKTRGEWRRNIDTKLNANKEMKEFFYKGGIKEKD
jgi:hypothetical protein